ncbi:MAG: MBL fold metallo-hydrolase [Bacteroidales bacterium]|nr:MBL fold metallo-hydrolase [Bacteroidales bacterium]
MNEIDVANFTPLNIAQESGFIEIADFLKSKGGILPKPAIVNIGSGKEKVSQIKVTYTANMGVLISSASKNILIDVLFDNGYGSYQCPSPYLISKINNLEAPLNSIDLVLVSHNDGDHFSAPMIAEYLSKNKNAKVVCSNLTSMELKKVEGYHIDTSRIVAITPELYNSVDTIVNTIRIKILRLRHADGDGKEENIGFVVDMDGVNVFHSGDSGGKVSPNQAVSGIQEYDSISIDKMNIDLAILNRGFLRSSSSPGLQIIEQYMKPDYILLTHLSENNKDGEWDPVDQTIISNKEMLPGITLFKFPMQSIISGKGINLHLFKSDSIQTQPPK